MFFIYYLFLYCSVATRVSVLYLLRCVVLSFNYITPVNVNWVDFRFLFYAKNYFWWNSWPYSFVFSLKISAESASPEAKLDRIKTHSIPFNQFNSIALHPWNTFAGGYEPPPPIVMPLQEWEVNFLSWLSSSTSYVIKRLIFLSKQVKDLVFRMKFYCLCPSMILYDA